VTRGQFRPEIRPAGDDDDEWSKQSAFFDWLSALSVGISLRIATDENADLIDHERKRSLPGTAALTVLASCTDPGDGQSLEEIIREIARPPAEPAPAGQAESTGPDRRPPVLSRPADRCPR